MHDLSEIAGGSPRNIRLRCLSFAPESSYRIRYAHFVWHLFVLAGTACHFMAVLRYAA